MQDSRTIEQKLDEKANCPICRKSFEFEDRPCDKHRPMGYDVRNSCISIDDVE